MSVYLTFRACKKTKFPLCPDLLKSWYNVIALCVIDPGNTTCSGGVLSYKML